MAAALNLKKFDPSKIEKGAVVVLIGKRKTGKSFLVKDLLYYKRDIPVGTVISGSEGSNCFYGDMMPSLFIHEDFKSEIVDSLVKRQQLVMTKYLIDVQKKGRSNIDPWAFLILDDLMYDTSWLKNITIRKLFMNGRHLHILYMITQQYCLGLPPALRTNVDYVFILREPNISNRKRLYEQYAGIFPSFEIFCQVMDQCTENFECLVIDNTCQSNKIEDMVFWYKAEMHPPYKIGAPAFWQYHNQHFSGSSNNDDDDINEITKNKRKGPLINVNKNY
jgi:hypothetical protein